MEKEGSFSSETVKELEEDEEVENLKKVEAALFLSARFLTMQDLVMLTDINPLMLRELLNRLIEKYNKDDVAMEIISKENMWKMDVKKEYVGMINKLATGNAEFTKAEQETLAVIAYKQPVKQSVIIKIRGNKAYDHIKHFREIGLVQAKRSGHTMELKLSDDFFEYFHLQRKEGEEIVMDSMISDEAKERYEEAEREVEEEEKVEETTVKQTGENKEEKIAEEKIGEKIKENEEKLRYPLEKSVRVMDINDHPETPATKEINGEEEISYKKSVEENEEEKIEEKVNLIQTEEEQKKEEKRLEKEIKKIEKKEEEIEKREEIKDEKNLEEGEKKVREIQTEEDNIESEGERKVIEIEDEENTIEILADKESESEEKVEEQKIEENAGNKEEIKVIEINDEEKSQDNNPSESYLDSEEKEADEKNNKELIN